MEVGASLTSLQLVSVLNDIEDINETQIFAIRDIKYIVQNEEIKGSIKNNSHELSQLKSHTLESAESNLIKNEYRNDVKEADLSVEKSSAIMGDDKYFRYMRVQFSSSSDFYGRIIIYNFEVHGHERKEDRDR